MARTRTRQRWTTSRAKLYWSTRKWYTVLKFADRNQRISRAAMRKHERHTRMTARYDDFLRQNYVNHQQVTNDEGWPHRAASDLQFWCRNASWKFCKDCRVLHENKLLNSFGSRIPKTTVSSCFCKKSMYVAARYDKIPIPLRRLTFNDICLLRPLNLHQGDYVMLPHGYRKKTTLSRCSWSAVSVQEKIHSLEDPESRERCQTAYDYLMAQPESAYAHFVTERQRCLRQRQDFNMYDNRSNKGIECCLWPPLYPTRSWCETSLCGDGTKSSTTRSFILKIKSEILDYNLLFDLVQLHYDLWLFRTVSGAISSGVTRHCSPARALDTKVFSPQFWKWHHLQLVDAVLQFGFPKAFITISPFEWTFPSTTFMENARALCGISPTEAAPFESLHIAHVIEQFVRGYFTGANSALWRKHVFRNETDPRIPVVTNYFYRLEFQNRGTCHAHILVWLDWGQTNTSEIRADIPWQEPEMAFLVHDLQSSDVNAIPLRSEPTTVEIEDGKNVLRVYHPVDAFANNIRGYLASVLSSLRCRMDVQTTDERAMVLRYVTSYVSKANDSQVSELSFSSHVLPYMMAYRYVSTIRPTVPEMVLQMSTVKLAWHGRDSKRFVPPRFEKFHDDKIIREYIARDDASSDLTLVEWARTFVLNSKNKKKHRMSALVAVRYNSVYHDEYFFQDLICNFPFRTLDDVLHPQHTTIPENLRFFAASSFRTPARWSDDDVVRKRLILGCNKDLYIDNVLHYIRSMRERLRAWEQRLTTASLTDALSDDVPLPLQAEQISAFQTIKTMVDARNTFYEDINSVLALASDPQTSSWSARTSPEWSKYLMIQGKPGTGKSHLVRHVALWAKENQYSLAIAVPTGMLVSFYREHVPLEVTVDTVHSLFHVAVEEDIPMQLGDELAHYDLLLLDEISMIPLRIAQHVFTTIAHLHVRPVTILVGDPHQQQPIDTVQGITRQTQNMYALEDLPQVSRSITLHTQHRLEDPLLSSLVDHLRLSTATYSVLRQLSRNRVICPDGICHVNSLLLFRQQNPDVTFITVSKAQAAFLNANLSLSVNANNSPLASCVLDTDPPTHHNLYADMPVMITRNVNKSKGVVNGRLGRVKRLLGNSVQIDVKDNKTLLVHPVTILAPQTYEGKVVVYPLVPAYAFTICKAQGQTLSRVAIYFDVDTVPAGSAYVAITRVRKLNDLYFVVPPKLQHFIPVQQF